MLTRLFGKAGNIYYDFARGIDLRPIEPERVRKSVGCEHTLEKDITNSSSVIIELYHVAQELIERIKRSHFSGNTLTLKIKFYDFKQITRSITQEQELHEMASILPLAKQLLKDVDYSIRPIRLIGLTVSNPKEEKEEKKTECSCLVNTSFNVRGEPIVCDEKDAYRCFMNTEMDCVVIGNRFFKKEDQKGGKKRAK